MATIGATRNIATRPPAWAYLWWLAVGALVVFGFLAGFTIGIPFLLLGCVLAIAGAAIRATRSLAMTAVAAGFALPLFYIAWLNRDGPGTICTKGATYQSCEEQSNPWPWAVAGVLLIAATLVLTVVGRVLTPTRRG